MRFLIETVDANNKTNFDGFHSSKDAYDYFGKICDGYIYEGVKESTLYIKQNAIYRTVYKYRLLGEGTSVLETLGFNLEV